MRANETDMASHDVGIGDFVLLDEITVERVVDNLKTRCVHSGRLRSEICRRDSWQVDRGERPALSRFIPASARGRGLRVGRWSPRDSEGFTRSWSLYPPKRLSRDPLICFDPNSSHGTVTLYVGSEIRTGESQEEEEFMFSFLHSSYFKPNGKSFWRCLEICRCWPIMYYVIILSTFHFEKRSSRIYYLIIYIIT